MGLLCLPDHLNDIESANETCVKEQRENYASLKEKYKAELSLPEELELRFQDSSCDVAAEFDDEVEEEDMDPLSIFLIEKEIQERREERHFRRTERDMIRQSRNVSDSEIDQSTYSSDDSALDPSEVLSVITKDLNRLQLDHHSCFHGHHKDMDYALAVQQRCEHLKEILFIHARECPRMGYQQGMHDLASLLMLAIELDVYDKQEAPSILCQEDFLVHDAYFMLCFVSGQLQPAFGVNESDTPIEDMVQNILSTLKFVSSEHFLLIHLTHMHLPLELFCARWVRLMFSREVVDWQDSLVMWDIFFDAVTKHSTILSLEDASRYTRPGITNQIVMGNFSLMQVLETCAASYLWLHRDKILCQTPSEAFRYLVNLPPTKSVDRLLSTLLASLRRVQYGVRPSAKGTTSPQSVLDVFRLKSSIYHILQRKDSHIKKEPIPIEKPYKDRATKDTASKWRMSPVSSKPSGSLKIECSPETLSESFTAFSARKMFQGNEAPPPPF